MTITTKNRGQLKAYFVKNAIPSERNFAELIDAPLNQADDGVFRLPNEPLSVVAAPGDQQQVLRLYATYPSANPDWQLTLQPAQRPGDGTIRRGLGVADGAGNLRLFVDAANGNVGVGTNTPREALDVAGNIKANRFVGDNSLALADFQAVKPASNVYLWSPGGDRDAWLYLDRADANSNWGIYHRQLDAPVKGLPGNAIGFVGGGNSTLKAYIGLQDGSAFFAGPLTVQSSATFVVGGVADWDRLVLSSSTDWGTGQSFATIGPRVMLRLPHVPWDKTRNQAAMFWGLAGGVADGAHWNIGLRPDASFTFIPNGGGADGKEKLKIAHVGPVTASSGLVASGLNVGTNGAQTTYPAPYETIGTDHPSHNLRLASRGALVTHAANGVTIGKDYGGNGNLRAEGQLFAGGYSSSAGNINAYSVEIGSPTPDGTTGQATLILHHHGAIAHQLRYASGSLYLEKVTNGWGTSDTPNLVVGGTCRTRKLQLWDKWLMSGVGDAHGNDDWLRLFNANGTDYRGGIAMGILWVADGKLQSSDRRLKRDIEPVGGALERIVKLRGVHFHWKDPARDPRPRLGFIAQDVAALFPELVSEGPDGMLALDHDGLLAPLVEAVREQQAQITELRGRLARLAGDA